jgi:hypothetical protein
VISDARCDDDDVGLTRVETAPEAIQHTYAARFACRNPGHHAATITFVANYPGGDAGPVQARIHAGYFVTGSRNIDRGVGK